MLLQRHVMQRGAERLLIIFSSLRCGHSVEMLGFGTHDAAVVCSVFFSTDHKGLSMAYVQIDGKRYEKELMDLAKHHTTGAGEGKLSKAEVKDLFASANDGTGVTDTEKATLAYIRENFVFTDAAARDFDAAFAAL